jgi:uncharacterized membrane protein
MGILSLIVKRFPFLDWMRGLAIVIMIQCHTFNSFVRMDLREGGPYLLSQFVGGMAGPLFLFLSGMTLAFQMDSLDRREPNRRRRWLASLRRGGYILGIAFAFRVTNWVASLPHADVHDLTKVDILNCMGVGLMVLSVAAVFGAKGRARFAAAAGFAIAAAAPLVSAIPWNHAPSLVREYLAPSSVPGYFAFFPYAAYIAFGLAAGAIVKSTAADRFERLMQWSVLIGLALVFTGQYCSNLPYSVYRNSSFWTDSPALTVIRAGISLVLMAGAYLWTEYCVGAGWSWMRCLGRNSLMVYWVHFSLVYGDPAKRLQRALSIPQTVFATLGVILLMVVLSAAWIWWKARRAERWKAATTVAGGEAQPLKAY